MTTTRAVVAGGLAGERDDLAIGIVAVGGDHGAVIGDIDGVERARCLQSRLDLGEEASVQPGLDRAMRVARREQQGDRLPGAGRIHGAHEGGGLAHDARMLGPGVLEDVLAAHDVGTGEIALAGRRCLPVALERHADDGHARDFHGALPCRGCDPPI